MGETLKRALFGSLFVTIVVLACLYSYYSLFGLMALVSTIGLYEWLKLQGIDSVPNLILTFMINYMVLGWGRPLIIQLNIGSSTVAIGQMSLVLFILFIIVITTTILYSYQFTNEQIHFKPYLINDIVSITDTKGS